MIGCGWLEEIHDWRDCKCLDIHLHHFPLRNCSYLLTRLNFREVEDLPTKMSATQLFIPSVYEEFLVVNRYDHLSYYRHPDHYQHLDHFQYIPAVIGHRVPGKNHVIYACYENTLAFFLEGLEDFSVWNRNRHVCQINFQDHFDFEAKGFWLTSTQLTKNKLAAVFSFFEVETDILVLLWKLDTLEPSEDNINFLTRLKISPWSRWTLSYKLHLNDIFVCIDDDDDPERKMMVINLVDHNDDTKHKMIQFETGELGNNDISIEEGESNRIALFKKTEMVFQLFNLESGTCMINLDLMYILPDFVRGNDFFRKNIRC